MTDHGHDGPASAGTMGWVKGCAIGCAAVVVLGLLLSAGGVVFTVRPFQRAVDAREELEERFGAQEDFTPPADGAIPAERLEAFLAVRRSLSGPCAGLHRAFSQMSRLEEMDEQETVDRGEVMVEAFKVTRTALGLGHLMGEFFEARNAALLEAEMGLGEYTYIFVLAYGDRLHEEREFGEFLDGDAVNPRIQEALAGMLSRQLEALREAPAGEAALVASLEAEITALGNEPGRLPWQDGLPPAIHASLAPSMQALDELYCEPAVPIELLRNRSRALAIESE